VTLLSLRPLRFYVANDKRSLPQSAQSCGEKEMELMRTKGLVLWRHRASFQVHHEALEHCSVTLVADGGQVTEPVEGGWTNSFDGNEIVKRTERTVCRAIRDDASRKHVANAR